MSCFVDAAANVVAGSLLTKASYDNAIQLLKNHFGRKDLVINTLTAKHFDLNPFKRKKMIPGKLMN